MPPRLRFRNAAPAVVVLAALLTAFSAPAQPFQSAPLSQSQVVAPAGAPSALAQRSASQMRVSALRLVQDQRRAIAREAAFFGYDLSTPVWTFRQIVCRPIPGYLLLHYRRVSRRGSLFVFTALVPRSSGRVYVVPVLYGNATPYRSAAASERTLAVFNRVVPPSLVEQALQPGGSWLQLAQCYAALAGAGGEVLTASADRDAASPAPPPTLQFSAAGGNPAVTFAEDRGSRISIWNVAFNRHGQAVSASESTRAAAAATAIPSPATPAAESASAAAPTPAPAHKIPKSARKKHEPIHPAGPRWVPIHPAPPPAPQPLPQ